MEYAPIGIFSLISCIAALILTTGSGRIPGGGLVDTYIADRFEKKYASKHLRKA